jgi:hypothetical protein
LEINKVIPGRTYTLRAGTDLRDFRDLVNAFTVATEEMDRIEVDSDASSDRKFYQLEIRK